MVNYLYIDDQTTSITNGTVSGLKRANELHVELQRPESEWEKQLELFKNFEFDGLILDLRLNDEANENGKKSKFRGTSIAQEIRTLSKEKEIKEFPVILLSATRMLKESLDKTGDDLFDLCVEKESLDVSFSFVRFRSILIALAEGYKSLIGGNKKLNSLLDLNDTSSLDIRFIDILKNYLNKSPHIFSGFFINEILNKSGPLINENLLAARLGVNKENSADWPVLLEKLKAFKYSGVFSTGWDRWWMDGLEDWWKLIISNSGSLRTLSAEQKVNLLKEKLGLQLLIPAIKSNKSRSNSFWTVCKGSKIPLDTIDGLVIANQENLYPWQDMEYISIDEALTRKNVYLWKEISPLEFDRFEKYKLIFRNDRPPRQQI